jgi:hypothetical protein
MLFSDIREVLDQWHDPAVMISLAKMAKLYYYTLFCMNIHHIV